MFFQRLKILPLLIFVAMLAFSVRLADVMITGVPDFSGSAFAEAAAPEEVAAAPSQDKLKAPAEKAPEAKPEEEKKEEGLVIKDDVNKPEGEDAAEAEHQEGDKKEADHADQKPGEAPTGEWKDAGDSDLEFGDVKMEMFADLTKRRDELDKREAAIVTKEALLKAAEQELDRKYQELSQLRTELQGLLKQQEDEENARIGSLVKVYEGMKPQDAARIFDTLDIDVLIAVMSKMSERKLSPVLASMNAERAKTITMMLAEQKQLPELPPSN